MEAKTVLKLFEVLLCFFVMLIDKLVEEEATLQPMMRLSYQRKKKKYLGVYNSVLRGVIMEDDAWPSYAPLIAELHGLVDGQVGAASGSEASPGMAGHDTVEYAQKILTARSGLQPALTE